jgi:hypothetical protein
VPRCVPATALRVTSMDEELGRLVWERARHQCESCQMPQALSLLPFEIDHIIARQHRGKTVAGNLVLACAYDNGFKGPNIAGLDPRTGRLVRLFHPRRHHWQHHFRWDGPVLVGRSAIGRTTIEVLAMNHPLRVEHRRALVDAGLFPPSEG